MATPSQATTGPAGKLPWVWLALSVAALLACWNPFAAPFGLLVGVASAALGLLAVRRRSGNRLAAAAALAIGTLAAVVAGLILWLTAGAVTGDLAGEPVTRGRSAAEAGALLDAARNASDPARQRARKELEAASARTGTIGESAKEDAPLEPAPPPPASLRADEPE